MALTPREERQLLLDLSSGRITQEEYNSIRQYQLKRDAQTSLGKAPVPLTEAEKRLFTRAGTSTTQFTKYSGTSAVAAGPTTSNFVDDRPPMDEEEKKFYETTKEPEIDTTTRSPGITNQFGTPPQDKETITVTDTEGGRPDDFVPDEEEQDYLNKTNNNDNDSVDNNDDNSVNNNNDDSVKTVIEEPDEYGYTPSQYQAGIAIYRKDAPAGGERVFSNADLKKALTDGYSLTAVDITEGPDAGTSADGSAMESGTAGTSTGFANSQIWEYNGQKYVVWQIPNTMMYMRYVATDSELDQLFSGRERPSTVTPSDTLWTSSVYFGNVYELSDSVITDGESPFFGFVDNFDKATKGRPWLVDDDEMFALWVEGYVEDRTIGEEEWAETSWFNNATKEEREWLILSKGRGVGDADFPADAQRKLEQDAIYYRNLMKSKGIANADTIKDANGVTFAEWFANQVTFGIFDVTTAADQINGLADSTSGITIDDRITNWLQGKGEVSQTRRGYASARNLALKWLGPVYGALDDETLARYAGIIRNAENPDVGAELLQEELKAQRKVLFSTDIYDENLTYEQIAAPWLNYSTRVLGERIDEKSEHWLNILLKNDQVEADKEITAYGLTTT